MNSGQANEIIDGGYQKSARVPKSARPWRLRHQNGSTKKRAHEDRTESQQAAGTERLKRKAAGLRKAARMLSTQELDELPAVSSPVRARARKKLRQCTRAKLASHASSPASSDRSLSPVSYTHLTLPTILLV